MEQKDIILEIKNLSLGFSSHGSAIPLLNKVSFQVYKNETVAIVGESGCGKSITAMSIMRLLKTPPARYLGGEILFQSEDLLKMKEKQLRKIRGNRISMIFQEPLTSLNPVLTVEDQLGEAIRLHTSCSKREVRQRCIELLKKVKIPSPELRLKSYPNQFSGGMRQRIMIAMSIACNPQLLIADEPTTALDVTIQAQILKLLKQIQQDSKMSILLITHDLGVVAEFAQRVIVMYAGQIIESACTRELFKNPQHPYTKGLIASLPKVGESSGRLNTIAGSVPSPKEMPAGCRFNPRCNHFTPECALKEPTLKEVSPNHFCKCHLQRGI